MSDNRDARLRTDVKHGSGLGPGRLIVSAIVVVACIVVLLAFVLFGGERSANPISTAGSAATSTTAPGDRVKP